MRSGFFNSNIEGFDDFGNPIYDRAEEASFFAEFFADFIGNGIYPNPSVGMQVLADTGMDLQIEPGRCFINGYRGKVEEGGEIITIENSDTNFNRIDRIVARLDLEDRKITINVLKGTPSANPIATDLTRNSNIYELGLADVTINRNSSIITQANIEDTRLDTNLCGIVSGIIDQVDTTTLFNQYQTWFQERMEEADQNYNNWFKEFTEPAEADFIDWFNEMKEQLTEDAAGHLQEEINILKASKVDVENTLTSTSTTSALSANQGKKLNEKIETLRGTVLFESENGTSNHIALSEPIENFKYFEIESYVIYTNAKVYTTTGKLPIASKGRVHLNNGFLSVNGNVQFASKRVALNSTALSVISDRYKDANGHTDAGTFTYITKVTGYDRVTTIE